jgi:hypothetical protein
MEGAAGMVDAFTTYSGWFMGLCSSKRGHPGMLCAAADEGAEAAIWSHMMLSVAA